MSFKNDLAFYSPIKYYTNKAIFSNDQTHIRLDRELLVIKFYTILCFLNVNKLACLSWQYFQPGANDIQLLMGVTEQHVLDTNAGKQMS